MSQFFDPLEFYAREYTKASGVEVTKEQITVESVSPVPNYYPPEKRVKNTLAKIVYNNVPVNVFYNRVSFTRYSGVSVKASLVLPYNTTGKVRDLVPLLNKTFGWNFAPEEFDDTSFSLSPVPATITFQLSSVCRFFLPASFSLPVGGSYELIDGELFLTPFDFAYTPDNYAEDYANAGLTGSKASAPLQTARFDYTPVREVIRNWYTHYSWIDDQRLVTDRLQANGLLLAALKSVDGQDWTVGNGTYKNDIYKAWGVYNGPTKGARGVMAMMYRSLPDVLATLDLVNEEFDNVLVLRGNVTGSNTYGDCYLFHYNDSVKKGRV